MRWLSKLLVVSILCLIAAAIPGVPAQAVCVPYDIQVSPKYGPPGTNVTGYGHDFFTNKLVDIAGFGIGLERTVSWICGLDHLREAIPFPRMIYRNTP